MIERHLLGDEGAAEAVNGIDGEFGPVFPGSPVVERPDRVVGGGGLGVIVRQVEDEGLDCVVVGGGEELCGAFRAYPGRHGQEGQLHVARKVILRGHVGGDIFGEDGLAGGAGIQEGEVEQAVEVIAGRGVVGGEGLDRGGEVVDEGVS